ncbi:MAG: SUMF1/EgtB/PvdO family nonheme iron enzyme [Planctomycetota bacterium]
MRNVTLWFTIPWPANAGRARSYVRRVVRGGSWNNPAINARAANRNNNHPENRNNNLGFRVCCGSHIFALLLRARSNGGRASPRCLGWPEVLLGFRKRSSATAHGPRRRSRDGGAQSGPNGHGSVGRTLNRGAPWRSFAWSASLFGSRPRSGPALAAAPPPAEESSHLRHQSAHVLDCPSLSQCHWWARRR